MSLHFTTTIFKIANFVSVFCAILCIECILHDNPTFFFCYAVFVLINQGRLSNDICYSIL